MANPVTDLLNGVRDLRIRQAVLVTALREIGKPLHVTREAVYDAAAYDIEVKYANNGVVVELKPARA